MKKALYAAIVIGFVAVMFTVAMFLDLLLYAKEPSFPNGTAQIFMVAKGQRFKATTEALSKAGLIKSPLKFYLLARLNGHDKQIKAGEYLLSGNMSPRDLLERLVNGKSVLHRLTIPEGDTLVQVAKLVQKAGLAQEQAFLAAACDPAATAAWGIPADTFEGYLFPDTYHFPLSQTPAGIVDTMVKRFYQVFDQRWQKRAEELGMSVHEVVILASMIEKETGAAFERPIISSVFHNRLKKQMRLESDPTVIYGIKNFDGNLTRKHLQTPTPYNTYQMRGLPAGPIANPGRASLEAALYPDHTDFLFFVSKNDSTHKFSTNINDHLKAVRKYQLRR